MAWIVRVALSCQYASFCHGAAQGSTPVVRFLEIGDRGLVFGNAPATADVEISAGEPFEGELRAILRYTPDWKETPSVSDQCIVPMTLARNERPRVQLVFPHSTGYGSEAPQHVDIIWKLIDSKGVRAATGREKAEQDGAGARVLNLTFEAGPGYRRRAVEAFAQPLRYQPYRVVTVEAEDLVSLSDRQQQSLLGAVAFGLTLVVSGGFGPLGSRWDGILDGSETTAWRAGASEIRETRFFSGRLRRTNISLGAFAALQEPEDPRFFPYALATSPETLSPAALETWIRYSVAPLIALGDRKQTVRLTTTGITIGLLVPCILLFIWRSSHLERPLGQFNALFGAFCIVALSPLMYAVLSRFPAGNAAGTISVHFHDPKGHWDRVDEVQWAGGGGGTRVPALALEAGGSKSFVVEQPRQKMYRPWMTATQVGSDYELRLESPAFSGKNLLILQTSAITRANPVWRPSLSWERGRPVGSIMFRKALRRVVLIFGERTLRLGPIPEGTVVDISRVAISNMKEFQRPGEPEEDSDPGMVGRAMIERMPGAAITIIGEEETPVATPAPARPGTRSQLHVERVDVPEAGADTKEFVNVPAYQRGMEIHAGIPDVIPAGIFKYHGSEPVDSLPAPGLRELIFPAPTPFKSSDYRDSLRTDLPRRSFSIPIAVSREKRK